MDTPEQNAEKLAGSEINVASEKVTPANSPRWSRAGRVRWAKLGLRLAVAGWVLLVATGFYALGDPQPGPDFDRRVAAKLEVVQLFMLLIGFCYTGSLISSVVGLFSPSRTRAVIALVLVLAAAALMVAPLWSQIAGTN